MKQIKQAIIRLIVSVIDKIAKKLEKSNDGFNFIQDAYNDESNVIVFDYPFTIPDVSFKPIEPIFEFWNDEDEITIRQSMFSDVELLKITKTDEAKILGVCGCGSKYFKLNNSNYPKCAECNIDLTKRLTVTEVIKLNYE